ncbi:MAG: phosphate ABC transporter permease PstA [Treponema sp.]|nr:phosphate ABC transporter permease PstA [Treponema sp.]
MKFSTKRKIGDSVMYALMLLGLFGVISALVYILFYIFSNSAGFLNWTFITGVEHGILPMIVTTVFVLAVSIGIALPVGIATAVYLNEYSGNSSRVKVLRLAIDTLAGIPSIIYGLFGLLVFSRLMGFGQSIIAGGLTLSIMALPVIVRTTEESLKSIPNSVREGSLALGATKFQTILHVVLPPALPGIITAVILAVGRMLGESAPVLLTVGISRNLPLSIFESGRTLTIHLYHLTSEAINPEDFNMAFATASVLILLVVAINSITKIITLKFRKNVSTQ